MLKKIDKFLPRTELTKNISTLVMGTGFSQLVPILISPFLTRIYTPEEFGTLALFIGIVSLFSVISSGRYELAILLPKRDEDAINILALALLISLLFSLLIFLFIFFGKDFFVLSINNYGVVKWLYLIPLGVFFSNLFKVLSYYNNRKKQYKSIAKATVTKSFVLSISQIGFGVMKLTTLGLIYGQVLSFFSSNLKLLNSVISDKHLVSQVSWKEMIINGKRYIKFPKFDTWSAFLNTFSIHIITFLTTLFFGELILGYVSFSQRIVTLPVTFIGASVSQVFFRELSVVKDNKEKLKLEVFLMYKKLFKIGIIPFSILLFFSNNFFGFIFGAHWEQAGVYAQMFSMWMFAVFVISPISTVLLVLEKQKQFLIFNIILFVFRFLIMLIGGSILKDSFYTYLVFGMFGFFAQFLFGVYIFNILKIEIKKIFFTSLKLMFFSFGFFGLIKVIIFKRWFF